MTNKIKHVLATLLSLVAAGGCAGEAGENETLGTASDELITTSGAGYLGFPTKDASIVSRGTDLLDLFTISNNLVRYDLYAVRPGNVYPTWDTEPALGKPASIAQFLKVAATKNGSRIDLIAVGSDNKLWHRFTTNNDMSPQWNQPGWLADIPGNPTVKAGSNIAITSWGTGRLDLFWWTPSNNLGHAWAENHVWQGSESGDTPGKPQLVPLISDGESDLSAVSWGANRIDIFYTHGSFLNHHWYANGWNANTRESIRPYTQDDQISQLFAPYSVAVTSRSSNHLDIFVTGDAGLGTFVYRTEYISGWAKPFSPPDAVTFQRLQHTGAAPGHVNTALRWNGATRFDVFSATNNNLWQVYKN